MTTSIIAAAMMRDVSRDARRRVGRERGGDERFSQPDPVALASLNPKNRGRAETATARASRRARATPLSVIHVFGVRTFPK